WITIAAYRRVNRLPDVPLSARATLCSQSQLKIIHVFHSRSQFAQIIPFAGTWHVFPRRVSVIGIVVFVNVDDCVSAEVNRIRTGSPTAVVLFGIKHLRGQSFPTTGRSAIEKTCPALPDTAKPFLDLRDQFVGDRIAV